MFARLNINKSGTVPIRHSSAPHKIFSLKEVCNKDLNLKNYSYSKDDNSYIKYYMYETNEGDALLNLYAEYLAIDEKFDLVSSNNSTVLEKQLEGAKCRIEMNCEEDSLELVLRYIYET